MAHSESNRRRNMVALAVLVVFLGVSVLVAAGWNSGSPGEQVSGTVYEGAEPLRSDKHYTWTVVFVGPNGSQAGGPIGQDGSYTVRNVPAGPVQIAIVGSRVAGMVTPGEKPQPTDAAQLARARRLDHCKDPAKSGLTFTVARGKQQHDIRLPQ